VVFAALAVTVMAALLSLAGPLRAGGKGYVYGGALGLAMAELTWLAVSIAQWQDEAGLLGSLAGAAAANGPASRAGSRAHDSDPSAPSVRTVRGLLAGDGRLPSLLRVVAGHHGATAVAVGAAQSVVRADARASPNLAPLLVYVAATHMMLALVLARYAARVADALHAASAWPAAEAGELQAAVAAADAAAAEERHQRLIESTRAWERIPRAVRFAGAARLPRVTRRRVTPRPEAAGRLALQRALVRYRSA
jgi:hypothetical protein